MSSASFSLLVILPNLPVPKDVDAFSRDAQDSPGLPDHSAKTNPINKQNEVSELHIDQHGGQLVSC